MPCSSSRSFPCNYCDRKFRSAQALGGHMNLHRRERVRLQNPITTLFSGSEVGFRYLFPANRDADALENWFGLSGAVLKNQPCSDTGIKANDVYCFDVKEERAKFHSYLPEFNSGLKSETGRKLETGEFYGDAAVGELDLELRL